MHGPVDPHRTGIDPRWVSPTTARWSLTVLKRTGVDLHTCTEPRVVKPIPDSELSPARTLAQSSG